MNHSLSFVAASLILTAGLIHGNAHGQLAPTAAIPAAPDQDQTAQAAQAERAANAAQAEKAANAAQAEKAASAAEAAKAAKAAREAQQQAQAAKRAAQRAREQAQRTQAREPRDQAASRERENPAHGDQAAERNKPEAEQPASPQDRDGRATQTPNEAEQRTSRNGAEVDRRSSQDPPTRHARRADAFEPADTTNPPERTGTAQPSQKRPDHASDHAKDLPDEQAHPADREEARREDRARQGERTADAAQDAAERAAHAAAAAERAAADAGWRLDEHRQLAEDERAAHNEREWRRRERERLEPLDPAFARRQLFIAPRIIEVPVLPALPGPQFAPELPPEVHVIERRIYDPERHVVIVVDDQNNQARELPYVALPVLFERGTAELLDEESRRTLEQMAGLILDVRRDEPNAVFSIEGHASTDGPADFNMRLSSERARRVFDELTLRYRVPVNMLTAQGYGENYPLHPNGTEAERILDRRVLIVRQQ